ncbi:hypothetical protein ACC692_37680, partial [Rhizobium ruizarguesonis]
PPRGQGQIIAAGRCRVRLAAFYKRVFYDDTVVPGRLAKNYGIDMTLMATNVIEVGRKLLKRYPFFISSASEQRMMFSRNPKDTLP